MIVEVDGKPAAELSLDQLRQLFRSDGRRVFSVEKGGRRRKVTFEMKR
jgi:hypothetical protein